MIPIVVYLLVVWIIIVLFYAFVRCTATPVQHTPGVVVAAAAGGGALCSGGLDPKVVNAIQTFAYESKTEGPQLECAICLSDFEEGETGRVMPECSHSFHIECIDMWLQSHRDCPLCRNRVKVSGIDDPVQPVENSQDGAVLVPIPEPCPTPGSRWRSGLPLYLFAI